MKRSVNIKWGEIRVGILIMFAFAALLYASFSGGGTSIFEDKVKYFSYFPNVNGLVKGSPVWIGGVEVGNVYSIEFVNLDSLRQIEVKYRIEKKLQKVVTIDAVIKVGTIGFIGDKYLELLPGNMSKPVIPEGEEVTSITPGDINAMLAEGEKTMTDARGLVGNLVEVTGMIKDGKGTVGQLFTNDTLFHNLTSMISQLTILIENLQVSQAKIVASIDNISGNLGGITEKVNQNEGTIGKLIADPALYDNLQASSSRIDSILAKINDGAGTAGAIINDDELYVDVKNLVVRIENLIADIEADPRKYFKFSVF